MYSNNAYSGIVGKAKELIARVTRRILLTFRISSWSGIPFFWNSLSIEPESIFFRWPLGSSASVKLSFNLSICSCDGFFFCATAFYMLMLLLLQHNIVALKSNCPPEYNHSTASLCLTLVFYFIKGKPNVKILSSISCMTWHWAELRFMLTPINISAYCNCFSYLLELLLLSLLQGTY